MRLSIFVLCYLSLFGMGDAKRARPLSLETTVSEARQHKLPALGFTFEMVRAYPGIDKFPGEHVYFRNQPSPPGGAYGIEMTEYSNYPGNDEGLRQWAADWRKNLKLTADGPDVVGPITVGNEPMRGVAFITGTSHARSQHLVLLFPQAKGESKGAALLLTWGPFAQKAANPADFLNTPAFGPVLSSLKVSR